MEVEEWVEIREAPGYFISSWGRVANGKTGKILKTDTATYSKFNYYTSTGMKQFLVHRLVGKYFLPGWDEGLEVNHLDGNKKNNHEDNLEWETSKGNNTHAIRTGLRQRRHTRVRIVETGEEFNSLKECAITINGNVKGVSNVLRGDKKSHRGLRFEYAD